MWTFFFYEYVRGIKYYAQNNELDSNKTDILRSEKYKRRHRFQDVLREIKKHTHTDTSSISVDWMCGDVLGAS